MIINAYSDCMPFRNGRGIVLIFWMIIELVLGYFWLASYITQTWQPWQQLTWTGNRLVTIAAAMHW